MIDQIILPWLSEVVKTQGATLIFVFVTSYWLMKRIEYLDKQIQDNNKFMQDCIGTHLNNGPTDQYRGFDKR